MSSAKPIVAICAVGLTPAHIGEHTPCLRRLAAEGFMAPMDASLPAVTTTGQTTMLTGVDPQQHGIVGNGWFFRDQNEVWLWRQSQRLVQAPHFWQQPGFTGKVLKHFWWYAMNTDVAATVTPRPVYHHDGRKDQDCYAWPPDLKTELVEKHGTFPLFRFWGPVANIESSRWIAESYVTAHRRVQPDVGLCYLPHLDYDFQRFGPEGAHVPENLAALDSCIQHLVDHLGDEVRFLVVSEYGLQAVDQAVFINKALREAGLLELTINAAGSLLDPGMSGAFAVADHQIAHIYCRDEDSRRRVHEVLARVDGIERIYVGEERSEIQLDHERAGDLVALAAPGHWFIFDYWLGDDPKPDFAHCVEIHKKPGYDPRELVFDNNGGKWRAMRGLLRKKLGLRYVMDPVGLDTAVVRGSHGRPAASPEHGPVIIGSDASWQRDHWHQRDVAGVLQQAGN